jgi:hypothetical protein
MRRAAASVEAGVTRGIEGDYARTQLAEGRRSAFLAIALAAVLVAAAVYAVLAPSEGPLDAPDSGGVVGVPADVDERVSIGHPGLQNPTDADIEIRRVEVVGKDPGLELVGALVFPGHSGLGSAIGFPPPTDRRARLVDATDATIESGQMFDVIIGVAASAPGRHTFEGFAIDYRAGVLSFREVVSSRTLLCAPERLGESCLDRDEDF